MACRGDCVGMGARAKIVSKRRVNRAFGATDGGARDSIPGVTLEASTFRQAVIENTLRSCQLFMGLPTTDIVAIASFVVPKHLDKGDYLFREGDRSEGFYVVQKGAINVHRVSSAGKEQVIHVFRHIESFAEATLATEGGYPADARATEPTTVLLVPKNEFVDLLRRRPDLALRMLGSMSQHLRVIVGLLDDLTLKDKETWASCDHRWRKALSTAWNRIAGCSAIIANKHLCCSLSFLIRTMRVWKLIGDNCWAICRRVSCKRG